MKRTVIGSMLVSAALLGASVPATAQQYPPAPTPPTPAATGPVVVNPDTSRPPTVEVVSSTSAFRPPTVTAIITIPTSDPVRFNVEASRVEIGNIVIIYIYVPGRNSTLMLEDPDALVTMQATKGNRVRAGTATVRPDGTVRLPVLSFRKAGIYQIQLQDRKAKKSEWFNVKAERPKKAKKK